MRLIAFGDSHTYGGELPGGSGHGHAGKFGYDQPSPVAWPQLIANHLNCECVNVAQPGYSNKEILTRILKFQFQPMDRAVVMWTHVTRDVIFTHNDNDIKIGPNRINDSPRVKYYYMAHGDHDMQVSAWLYMDHAALYLQSQQVEFAMTTYDAWNPLSRIGKNHININKTFQDLGTDFVQDKIHFGVQSHISLSEQIISDLGW